MAGRRSNMERTTKVFVAILSFVSYSWASKCTDISGSWQNELGSHMHIKIGGAGRISGEYRTAVAANAGAAAVVSNITGVFSDENDGSLLVFSVLFNHGSSLTTWVGQCLVCEEKEVLHTTYILRSHVSDSRQKWMSLMVNQNTFWRSEEDRAHVVDPGFSSVSVVSPPNSVLNMAGNWKSNNNEEIKILEKNENVSEDDFEFNGKWKSSNNAETKVYGISDSLDGKRSTAHLVEAKEDSEFSAVALMAVSNKRVRGWIGYVSDGAFSSSKTLETAWIEHEFSSSCSTPRAIVQFGMNNFTRAAEDEHSLKKSETFLEKIQRFFTSMF